MNPQLRPGAPRASRARQDAQKLFVNAEVEIDPLARDHILEWTGEARCRASSGVRRGLVAIFSTTSVTTPRVFADGTASTTSSARGALL